MLERLLSAPAAASVDRRAHVSFADYLKDLERASVIRALDNLMRFPCIRVLVERQHLQLHAAHFDVATRLLSAFDLKAKTFVSVAGVEHSGLLPRF